MSEALIEWAVRLAVLFDAEPEVTEITVSMRGGGSMVVDDRGPRFVTHGLTLDIEDALGREVYAVAEKG